MNYGIVIKQNGDISSVALEKNGVVKKLHECVGGYIECVTLSDDLVMVVDEEGKLRGKGVNKIATEIFLCNNQYSDIIVGDVVICHISVLD